MHLTMHKCGADDDESSVGTLVLMHLPMCYIYLLYWVALEKKLVLMFDRHFNLSFAHDGKMAVKMVKECLHHGL